MGIDQRNGGTHPHERLGSDAIGPNVVVVPKSPNDGSLSAG